MAFIIEFTASSRMINGVEYVDFPISTLVAKERGCSAAVVVNQVEVLEDVQEWAAVGTDKGRVFYLSPPPEGSELVPVPNSFVFRKGDKIPILKDEEMAAEIEADRDDE